MTIEPSAIAIIPARGGSKGIPRKNLYIIGDKPLIAWTIEAARGCPYIASVVVTSDDEEIRSVAQGLGADVIERPAELASDTAGAKPVLQHALTEAQKKYGVLPRWVVYLQPTSPLRTAAHLTAAFESLIDHSAADALISVYEIDNSYLKASTLNADGFMEYAAKGEFANMNRQMLPKLYMPNGAIYIMQAQVCLQTPRFDGERTIPYVMSAADSIDLDSPADIPAIEQALASRVRS